MEMLKNKKTHITIAFGAIVFGAVLLFQGAVPKEAREPKIDAITPSQGLVGTEVVISGSGFTTSINGIVGTKVKDHVMDPGNYVLIKDEILAQPLLSPDGKTLTVRLELVSDKVKRECEQKFNKKNPEPCKVPIKVINAYGKPSNDVHFTFTGREIKKLYYTLTKLPTPSLVTVNVYKTAYGTYQSGQDEIMRIRISTPATNEKPINFIPITMIATDIPPDFTSLDGIRCQGLNGYNPSTPTIDQMAAAAVTADSPFPYSGGIGVGSGSSDLFGGQRYNRCVINLSIFGPFVPGITKDYSVRTENIITTAEHPTNTFYAILLSPHDDNILCSAVDSPNPGDGLSYYKDSLCSGYELASAPQGYMVVNSSIPYTNDSLPPNYSSWVNNLASNPIRLQFVSK